MTCKIQHGANLLSRQPSGQKYADDRRSEGGGKKFILERRRLCIWTMVKDKALLMEMKRESQSEIERESQSEI